jgi:hypothetical protein
LGPAHRDGSDPGQRRPFIAFFHAIFDGDDKSLDVVHAMPIKLNADAKLTEIWFLANDQRAYDQFWS